MVDLYAGSHATPLAEQVRIDEVRVRVAPDPMTRELLVDHLAVTVPPAAILALAQVAPVPGSVSLTITLGQGQIDIGVRASLLRLKVSFRPSVVDGQLILTPSGGVPGMLLGFASTIVSRQPGMSMNGDGRISVDPHRIAPRGIRLATGFTSVDVTPERMRLTLG